MKNYWAFFLLIIAPLTATAMGTTGPTAPETSFLSQPLFTLSGASGLSSSLQGLSRWSSNTSLNLNSEDAKTAGWVEVLKDASTPEGQRLLAPLFNALNSKSKAQLKGRIRALISSNNSQRQKILLSQITSLLEKGRKKSADRVLGLMR